MDDINQEQKKLDSKNPKPTIPGSLDSIKQRAIFPIKKRGYQSILVDFFAYYFKYKKLYQKIEQEKLLKGKVKLQIPINPSKYEFTKHFPEHSDILNECIAKYPYESLRIFKAVIENQIYPNSDKILVSFIYDIKKDKSFLKNHYFDDINKSENKLDKFSILKGFSQKNKKRSIIKIPKEYQYKCLNCGLEFGWIKEIPPNKCYNPKCKSSAQKHFKLIQITEIKKIIIFSLRDKNDNIIPCRIIDNVEFFENMDLNMETSIDVQGIQRIEEIKDKSGNRITQQYFEVIDIKVLKRFENISVTIGNYFNGIKELQSTEQGLIVYRYTEKDIYSNKILDGPIALLDIYDGENERYYEVELDGVIICKNKKDLILYIENNTNLSFVSGRDLRDYLSIILRGYEIQKNLKPKLMFNACGIFKTIKDEIVIVYPGQKDMEIRLYGENDFQIDIIERLKKIGIDEKGDLTKVYFDLIHLDTIPFKNIIITIGYCAISPLFYVLKDYLDVFPNLFAKGIPGTGKTFTFETFFNIFFGTEMQSPESIDSIARLTKMSTAYTTPMYVDNIEGIGDNQMNFIIVNSTRKLKRERMRKDQSRISEQTYPSYTGTTNKGDFLKTEKAFRLRCLILNWNKKIKSDEKGIIFQKLYSKIKKGKIFGYYLLNKAKEFIKNEISGDESDYEKLISLIDIYKKKITELLRKDNIELIDIRRETIYSLIYLGIQFWNYVFKIHNLESKQIKNILNLENKKFIEIIQELEQDLESIGFEEFENILEFFRKKEREYKININSDNEIVLLTNFINDYDDWAVPKRYPTLKSLANLGRMESELLGREVKTKMMRIKNIDINRVNIKRGLIFYIEEIEGLMGIKKNKESEEESDIDIINIKETEINDKVLNRIAKMISENNDKAVYVEGVIEVLDLENDLNKENVSRIIDLFIKKKILFNSGKKKDLIQLTEKGKLLFI
ncbi:hypothetical protein ES703_11032 [subsurface metagenome]